MKLNHNHVKLPEPVSVKAKIALIQRFSPLKEVVDYSFGACCIRQCEILSGFCMNKRNEDSG